MNRKNHYRHIRPVWDMPGQRVTPEHVFFNRRSFMGGVGAIAGTALIAGGTGPADAATKDDPSAKLYPFEKNEAFKLDRPITPEEVNTTYNNFYEFGSHKQIAAAAQALPIRPWEIMIDGEVENQGPIAIDDLMAKVPLEERLYRHRCVEAWSMTIPWSGFALRHLVEIAKPTSKAKYVRFETFKDPSIAPGQKQFWYPWPYVEGITLDEANHDLAFMVTGAYGKPMAKQFGAPIRLALPWKYGFKSIKSVVKISFTEDRPVSFWEQLNAREYGFWANVNPEVPHPRWSQETERVLGTDERIPTILFNGYGDEVARLYEGKENENLWR